MRVTSTYNRDVTGSSPVTVEIQCSSIGRTLTYSYRLFPIQKTTASGEDNGYFIGDIFRCR